MSGLCVCALCFEPFVINNSKVSHKIVRGGWKYCNRCYPKLLLMPEEWYHRNDYLKNK
jgi:hypothetical protein